MSKPKVLITREIPSPGVDLLKSECDVEMNLEDRALTRLELLSKAADKDAVLCLLTDKIDAEFFNAAPNLKGVANYAVGFDNMNVSEASSRGIPLSNTPEVLTEATAEMAWALLFSVARRIVESTVSAEPKSTSCVRCTRRFRYPHSCSPRPRGPCAQPQAESGGTR